VTQLIPLAIALGITLVGCLILWLRHRKPHTMEAHIREFTRELEALAPEARSRPTRTARAARTAHPRGPRP
jgi:hypothetical protein